MKTLYKFNGACFDNFADLCNAFKAERGYFPTKPSACYIEFKHWAVIYE